MLKKTFLVFFGLLLFSAVGLVATYFLTNPESPPVTTNSAYWLQPGPNEVGMYERVFVDPNRPTQPNGSFNGSPRRTLNTTIWYPVGLEGDLPLIIHSHGFVSSRTEMDYVSEHLASHGYVVAAADFPLTNGNAPGGGPLVNDVINQPGDVSYLISSMLTLRGDDKPYEGTLNPERIGVMGLSLGGLTTTLVAFHPEMQDTRIKGAIAIAGPGGFFTETFFRNSDVPYLMIAGTADGLIDYEAHAARIPELAPSGSLLTIEGGTHLGFVTLAEPALRLFHNPDSLGCQAVLSNLDEDSSDETFGSLGTPETGVEVTDDLPEVCEFGLAKAAHPGRQHMITKLAVLSFFNSVLAEEYAVRWSGETLLSTGLQQDFVEARYTR